MTSTLLMLRPAAFGYSPEAALSNTFQQLPSESPTTIATRALAEFDRMVQLLREEGIRVIVGEDSLDPPKPDAVFPNNWVSWHTDGRVLLYPMAVASRRAERREELIALVEGVIGSRKRVDLSTLEDSGIFVEGTGSLVFDRDRRLAFAGLSPRTSREGVERVCEILGYTPIFFRAELEGVPVYHSNVLLSLGPGWACWFGEGVTEGRKEVEQALKGRQILQLDAAQLRSYAGNVLALQGKDGPLTVLSRSAFEALRPEQRAILGRLLVVEIPTIERVGGGSARCMMAEVY